MKKFLATVLVATSLLIATPVNAEVVKFEGKGAYYIIQQKDRDKFHEIAKQKAAEDALEKACAYIKNYSRALNLNLTDEEILSLVSNTLETEEIGWVSPTFANGNLIVYGFTTIQIDTDKIDNQLKRDASERKPIIAQGNDFQKNFDERKRQLAELKEKLAEQERRAAETTPVATQEVGGKIFEGVGEYRIGNSETIIDAERGAKFLAMQDALTKADIPVYTYVDVKNFEPDKNFTTPKGRALLKIIDAKPEWKDFVCRMTVKVDINVAELNKWLKQQARGC